MIHIEQNTAILFGMACAIIALVFLIAYLVDEVIRLRANETISVEQDHDRCLARIILEMGDRTTAHHLRHLADTYDKAEGRPLVEAAKKKWTPEGPVLPVLWVREYADLLDPPLPEDGFVTLSGEHA